MATINYSEHPLYGNKRLIQFSREHSNPLHYLNRIKRHGEEIMIGTEKPVILAFFPHSSHFDPLMLYGELLHLGLHRNVIAAAAADYWFMKQFMTVLGNMMMPMFPMPRPDKGANLKETATILKYIGEERIAKRGESLIWAPEGTRSNDPIENRRLKSGIAHLARHSDRPVVPVVLRGLEKSWPRDQKLPNPEALVGNHVDVCFLPPLRWKEYNSEELFLDSLKRRYVQAYQELLQQQR